METKPVRMAGRFVEGAIEHWPRCDGRSTRVASTKNARAAHPSDTVAATAMVPWPVLSMRPMC
ncbi:MAG TPA: hypothetical protein VGC55_00250 [Dokdonella sp.]